MRIRGIPTRRLATAVLAMALATAGCFDTDRPSTAEWRTTWNEVRSAVPDLEAFAGGSDTELCTTTLGILRTRRGDLFPTPDRALDATVRGWFQVAEDVFFECPPTRGEFIGFDGGYAEMALFEAEIDAGLDASP